MLGSTPACRLVLLCNPVIDKIDNNSLGTANCVDSASFAFQSFKQGSTLLVGAITNHEVVCLTDHLAHLAMVHSGVSRSREDQFHQSLLSLLSSMPSMTTHADAVRRPVDFHTSG